MFMNELWHLILSVADKILHSLGASVDEYQVHNFDCMGGREM